MIAKTLFDKIWDSHVVADLGDGWALLHIDRHLLHDLSGTAGLYELAQRKLTVRNPELAFATPDHAVSSAPGRTGETHAGGARMYHGLLQLAARSGIRLFDLGEIGQGIVHVMAPELGITQPGMTLICGDSHTCTNGGLGALAFGVGTTEVMHALATQTLVQRRPKTMRLTFHGHLATGVVAKDLILHVIAQLGASTGTGYAIEYAGPTIRALDIEERLSLCNLSIELGAKIGMVAPDEKTNEWLRGKSYSPEGELFNQACDYWRTLSSDENACFDFEASFDVSDITPMITWGTSPEHAMRINETIPQPCDAPDVRQGEAWRNALEYMGLEPGQVIVGTPIDWVFIGSCGNSRLSDLRAAADIVRGRRVAVGVTAWVVPGSELVRRNAEAEGLHRLFLDAGFEWREPGCSLCVAANGERVPPQARIVSTSNRNFVGRQGPGARTHLASPAMAAAAAIAGKIVDIRNL